MHEFTTVGGEVVRLDVSQTSKNMWTVTGAIRGSTVVVSAMGRRTAVTRWRRVAETAPPRE